jgi:peptide/nickel transport system permease protein
MLIPLVTVVGLQLGALLGGAVITETIFAWPGVGRLVVTAITARDYPLVQAATLLVSVYFVGINLLLDVVYVYIDTRIRFA